MKVTRTVNGMPVGDGETRGYTITNRHVIEVLYQAMRRANRPEHAEADKGRQ